jgi:hypothetical protein
LFKDADSEDEGYESVAVDAPSFSIIAAKGKRDGCEEEDDSDDDEFELVPYSADR